MGRRFVPSSTITRRMDAKDARAERRADRIARATQARFPEFLNPAVPPVVEVAIVPVTDGPVVKVALTPIAQPRGARAAARRGTASTARTTREARGAQHAFEALTEPTGADVFGEPVPGEAVTIADVDPCQGETPRARWTRRTDGRPVRLDAQGRPTTRRPPERHKS
jgi:hypothetical protein